MIITIVTETFLPDVNGVSMTLGKLVTGLAEAGHKLQLVCPKNKNRNGETLPNNVSYHPVRGIPIPRYTEANFGLPSKSLLNKLWSTERPDVIYVATEGPLGRAAILLSEKLNIPSLSGFHTNFHSYSKYYGIGLMGRIVEHYLVNLHNRSAVTLTPTKTQKHMLNDMGIINVEVLSRGVDTTLFSPTKRCNYLRMSWGNCYEHEPVLLYVGRIASEKNINLAIETYHAMLKQDASLKFVLVGDGPLLKKLQEKHPDFIFAGMQTGEELAKYYASSDIFIFPSMTETFGNVVLEAMASGLGIIAYDYAAANMHIKHGVDGMLAEFDNAYEFTTYACEYLNQYNFLEEVKVNASHYALKQRWVDVVCQFETLLSEQAFKTVNNYLFDKQGINYSV